MIWDCADSNTIRSSKIIVMTPHKLDFVWDKKSFVTNLESGHGNRNCLYVVFMTATSDFPFCSVSFVRVKFDLNFYFAKLLTEVKKTKHTKK